MKRDIFGELKNELENKNLTKEEKTRLIEQAGEAYRKQVDTELNLYKAKQWGGLALECAAVAIPGGVFGGAGKVVGKAGVSALERTFGKKMVNDLIKSTASGALLSSLYGTGRGLIEDKNILRTSLEDATLGAITSAALGGVMGKLQKNLHEQNFQSYKNPNVLKQIGKKDVRNEVLNYYRNYIQGIADSRPEIGEYHYTSDGIREVLTQKFNNALDIGNLRNAIKDASYLGSEQLAHPRGKKNIITKFHRFRNKDTDYIFSENKYGKLNYHISKPAESIKNPKELTVKTEEPSGDGKFPSTKSITDYLDKNNPANWLNPNIGTSIIEVEHIDPQMVQSARNFYSELTEDIKKNTNITKDTPKSTPRTTNTDAPRSPINIITDGGENLNPSQLGSVENLPADVNSVPLQGYVQKSAFDDISPVNPFEKYNNGHSTGHAAPIDDSVLSSINMTARPAGAPYTPEEIGKMSQEEFNRSEGAIMEQLRKGQIGQQSPQTDYSTYKNPQSGKGRVFTREDLDKMSTNEYTKHESEIMAQMNSIGIPSKTEVSKSTTTYSQEKGSRQNTGSSEGRWVTINGNHVLIEK